VCATKVMNLSHIISIACDITVMLVIFKWYLIQIPFDSLNSNYNYNIFTVKLVFFLLIFHLLETRKVQSTLSRERIKKYVNI
jgi:predicted ferric reductase